MNDFIQLMTTMSITLMVIGSGALIINATRAGSLWRAVMYFLSAFWAVVLVAVVGSALFSVSIAGVVAFVETVRSNPMDGLMITLVSLIGMGAISFGISVLYDRHEVKKEREAYQKLRKRELDRAALEVASHE